MKEGKKMLVLKKYFNFYDFMDEFSYELEGISREGIIIIFDSLCEIMGDADYTAMDVSDYLRYQMQHLSLDEVISDYGRNMNIEGLEGDALVDAVVDHLNRKTYVLGHYEDDDTTYFIFDEF